MGFYTTQTGAKLKMGTSTADPLPAPGSDTFVEITIVEDFDPIAFEQTPSFFSVLSSTSRNSIGGRLNDVTISGTVALDWSTVGIATASQLETDARVAGGQKRNYQIIYPDSGARQYDGVAFISSFKASKFDANANASEHKAAITLAFTGVITVTP